MRTLVSAQVPGDLRHPTLIRTKIDLKTIQEYMGHADLEPTMRYLEAAELDEVQQSQFNDAFASHHSPKVIPMPQRRAS